MATLSSFHGRLWRVAANVFALWVVLLALGCGNARRADYSSLGLVAVAGTVQLDGAPLAGATVVFENEEGTFSEGITNDKGVYRLMYNSEQEGIVPGRKTVRITIRSAAEDSDAGSETIPERYNRRSEQVVKVSSSSNKFNFDLQSDP